MDFKGPIHPSFRGNSFIFVITDASSHFVVTSLAPQISCKFAIEKPNPSLEY